MTARALDCKASSPALPRITLLASELITNAVVHGPSDGTVVVRAEEVTPASWGYKLRGGAGKTVWFEAEL